MTELYFYPFNLISSFVLYREYRIHIYIGISDKQHIASQVFLRYHTGHTYILKSSFCDIQVQLGVL